MRFRNELSSLAEVSLYSVYLFKIYDIVIWSDVECVVHYKLSNARGAKNKQIFGKWCFDFRVVRFKMSDM